MRSRRVLAFLLGAWLAGALFITQATVQNYTVIERVMEHQNHPLCVKS